MTGHEARRLFSEARVARLATADASGQPHVVVIVFAVDGETLYSAVDGKPKHSTSLRRVANIVSNPRVTVLVDHYDDAHWDRLWWVRADGAARILPASAEEAHHGAALLTSRYRQYADGLSMGDVLAVDVERWSGWSSSPA